MKPSLEPEAPGVYLLYRTAEDRFPEPIRVEPQARSVRGLDFQFPLQELASRVPGGRLDGPLLLSPQTPDKTSYYVLVPGTEDFQVVVRHLQSHPETMAARDAKAREIGAIGWKGYDHICDGFIFPENAPPDPKLWKLERYIVWPDFWVPYRRTRKGRELYEWMRNSRCENGKDLAERMVALRTTNTLSCRVGSMEVAHYGERLLLYAHEVHPGTYKPHPLSSRIPEDLMSALKLFQRYSAAP